MIAKIAIVTTRIAIVITSIAPVTGPGRSARRGPSCAPGGGSNDGRWFSMAPASMEVRMATDRQRAIAAGNDFQKTKLQLARVIGLPPGQPFELVQDLPYVPVPEMTLEEALDRAYRERPDYLAALERVRAAEATRQALVAELLPSVRVQRMRSGGAR